MTGDACGHTLDTDRLSETSASTMRELSSSAVPTTDTVNCGTQRQVRDNPFNLPITAPTPLNY